MNTPARIVHQTSGRIRVEVPGKRGDKAFFAALAERMAQGGGVSRTRGNAAAASLVVEYAGPPNELLREFQRSELDLTPLPAPPQAASSPAAPAKARLPGRRPGKPSITPMTMVGAAFGVVGIVQTLRGEIMLPALSAFWYAATAMGVLPNDSSGNGGAHGAGDGATGP